jgi:Acetyltransferase (GNAT) domain
MSIAVERWSEDVLPAQAWDAFIAASDNGTLFHSRLFLGYHPVGRFTDHSLVVRSKGSIHTVLPAIEWMIDKDKTLYSHRGASYGGFVYADVGLEDAVEWTHALKEYAKEQDFSRIILTPPPMPYCSRATNYVDFALVQAGFRYQKRELTAVVQLSQLSQHQDPLSLFKPEARTAMRKAAKMGVRVQRSEAWGEYYDILARNLMMRHSVKPTHTLQELEFLARTFPEHILLNAAFVGDRMIAGVVNFIANDRTMLGFYISDNKDFQEYRSLNLLFYEIFKDCAARGIRYYDFGTFTLNMEPNIGLARFKETFGARGVFRDTFEIWL